MGKGALRPFFKGHSLKKEKEHKKKEVDKMLSHFVTLPFYVLVITQLFRKICHNFFNIRPRIGLGREITDNIFQHGTQHDVDALGAEGRADRRSRVGGTRGDLQLDKAGLLLFSHESFLSAE